MLPHTYILTRFIGKNWQKTCQPCFLVTALPSSPPGLLACLLKCFRSSRPACSTCAPASFRGMHCHYWFNCRCNCIKLCSVALPPQWIHYWAGLSAHCCFGVQYWTSNQYDTLQGKDWVRPQLAPSGYCVHATRREEGAVCFYREHELPKSSFSIWCCCESQIKMHCNSWHSWHLVHK